MCEIIKNVEAVEKVMKMFKDIEKFAYGITRKGDTFELVRLATVLKPKEVVGRIIADYSENKFEIEPIGTEFRGRRDIWNVFETYAVLDCEYDARYEAEELDLPILFGEAEIALYEARDYVNSLTSENEGLRTECRELREKAYNLEKRIASFKRGVITISEL